MAYRNCYEGFLCPECKSCPFWADGSDDCLGCDRPFATCDALDRACACDEIMNSKYHRVTSEKYGDGTALKLDMDASKNQMLVSFDDGTKAWVDISTLTQISDEEAS